MRAIVYSTYGPAEVLHMVSRDIPAPRSQQALIRVAAAGVNPIDWRVRAGELRFLLPGGFPRVPGFDVAGIVEQCPDDSGFQVGDRVIGFLDNLIGGGYAEYAVCGIGAMAKIPDAMSMEEAAGIPLAGSTAWQSLVDHGHMQAGAEVVVTGASGGVGTFAVQIAVNRGATVTGVASGANRELVESLGAARFLDYKTQSLDDLQSPCDLFFDAAGKTAFSDARRILKPNGRFVSTEPNASGVARTLFSKLLPGPRFRVMLAKSKRRDLEALIDLYRQGQLRVVLNKVFALEDAMEAHKHGEAGQGTGKIILKVA